MDALTPPETPQARTIHAQEASTRRLLVRLWREHLRAHRGRLLLVLLLTALMAGLTALYPVVIDRAFSMFTARDPRILYQVPALVVAITGAKAAVTYGQTVLTQGIVLRAIREASAPRRPLWRMYDVLARHGHIAGCGYLGEQVDLQAPRDSQNMDRCPGIDSGGDRDDPVAPKSDPARGI